MKKSIGLLVCSFCMALLAVAMLNPLKAEAAGRNVTIKYETDAWYMYINTEGYWKNYASIEDFFQDGDVVLIDSGNAASDVEITLNVNKSFETIAVNGEHAKALVTSKSVNQLYAANKATLIYSGNVKSAIANPACITQMFFAQSQLFITQIVFI